MRRTRLRSQSQTEIAKLTRKCDSYLTPIVKLSKPNCECCGKPTEVAHHWIEKSKSNFLRHELDNLVALCHSCHLKIHNRWGASIVRAYDVTRAVILKRGEEWKNNLDILAQKSIKFDVIFLQKRKEFLEKTLENLKNKLK